MENWSWVEVMAEQPTGKLDEEFLDEKLRFVELGLKSKFSSQAFLPYHLN